MSTLTMVQPGRRPEPRETTLGYELDTITLRDIAAVRYVHHHEWLDHVLGSSVPVSRIEPPRLFPEVTEEDLKKTLEELDTKLKTERELNAQLENNTGKEELLSQAIARLREDYGKSVPDEHVQEVEAFLGRKIIPAERIRSVPITYNRAAEEAMALDRADPMIE